MAIVASLNKTDSAEISEYTLSLKHRCLFLCEEIAAFAIKLNIKVSPYSHHNLPFFSSVPIEQQSLVVQFLENVYQTYLSIEKEKADLNDSKTVLWHSIKRLGLRPSSDLFNSISDTDIIEIHTPTFQAFRNLNFFRLCSYSVEELSCVHWTKLFFREQKHSDEILAIAKKVFTEQKPVVCSLPPHIVEELSSAQRLKVLYDLKGIFPLFETQSTGQRFALARIEAKLIKDIYN